MPNTFALIKKYVDKLDAVYAKASCTADLEADPALIRMGNNTHEILIPKMDMDGLGDYSRTDGYVSGSANLEWQTKTFDYDRGRKFSVDAMDNEETASLAFGKLAGEFVRTRVAPETDAYRFAKYTSLAGTVKSEDITLVDEFCAAVNYANTQLDEAEVPEEGRLLYVCPTLHNGVKELDTYKSKAMFADFSKIVRVPQRRFYSAVDLLSGRTDDELAGGFRIADGGKKINFMIIHPQTVIQFTKHRVNKTITPEANQSADAWMHFFRTYGLTEVYDEKKMGIYSSISAT